MSLQRVHPRARCHLTGGAEGARGPVGGTCTNVSQGGLFLEGVQLPLSSVTTVFIDHPRLGRITAQAIVRHHVSSPRGMGVQFTRLGTADLAALQALLAELERDPAAT